MCETLGKLHKRGEEWDSFPVWETIGVEEWMHQLDSREIGADEPDILDAQYAMPIPFYRTPSQTESWLRQARTQEGRISEFTGLHLSPETERMVLDDVFPQYTHNCNRSFGGQCAYYDLCWGSPQIAQDPLGSGIYQIHEQYADQPEAIQESD
jgi:hypothetical protein